MHAFVLALAAAALLARPFRRASNSGPAESGSIQTKSTATKAAPPQGANAAPCCAPVFARRSLAFRMDAIAASTATLAASAG